MMSIMNRSQHETSYFSLIFITVACLAFYGYLYLESMNINKFYDSILATPEAIAVKTVSIGDETSKLVIPDWSYFTPGSVWSLASLSHPLPKSFVAQNLTSTSVPHANDASRVSQTIEPALESMIKAASSEGYDLILSSAYRSVADQQALYENFVQTKGKAMADLYVAKPGTSEHHIGLAVDLADKDSKCEVDSNACNLSEASAAWLAKNAYKFGFILRYPEGKKPITGISYEPWHYRYVGKPFAKILQNSDVTLDEVLDQIYPANTK